MAEMAEKPSYGRDELQPDDSGTDIGHQQEMRIGYMDPYQNNYNLPSPGLGGPIFANAGGYETQANPPPQQQEYTGYGATNTNTRGPLVFTHGGGNGYQTNNQAPPEQPPHSNYSHDGPIAAHYAQHPYQLDSYYGSSEPAPAAQQQQMTNVRDPSTRSGPTEWGVAC